VVTRALIFLLLTFPALAQDAALRYAVAPDLATAKTYSVAAWTALQCTPQPDCDRAQVTKFWWPIIGLSDGTRYAVVLHDGDVYQSLTITLPSGKSFTLTQNQINALQTRAQMGTLLADILPLALVNGRATAPETTAITNYIGSHPAFKTKYQTLTSGPIDLLNPLTDTVFGELQTAGILTAARVAAILAPQASSPIN
jgi:hypothetical protein